MGTRVMTWLKNQVLKVIKIIIRVLHETLANYFPLQERSRPKKVEI